MPNLRIIYDNAADRATSLTASTTSGTLVASNMKTDIKGQVHRSTGTSVIYTLNWTNGETIGGVALPATNLTASATIRVQLYSDVGCLTEIADSGIIYACPGPTLEVWNWSLPLNANAFAFGGASKTTCWFQNQQVAKGCKITLVDSTNPAGYIDCARIVVGAFWEPTRNVQNGSLNIEIMDSSSRERNDAGDLISTRSIHHDKLSFDLAYIEEVDRQQLMRIARKNGTSRNMLVSVFNDNDNSVLTQDSTVYGKVVNFATTQQLYGFYSTPLEFEGW